MKYIYVTDKIIVKINIGGFFMAITEKEKMILGLPYNPADPELTKGRIRARILFQKFNKLDLPDNEEAADKTFKERSNILKELLGSTGESIYMEPNFKCDYGYNISVGNNFYANFDCVMLDVCKITIGENCFFAPGVPFIQLLIQLILLKG